MAEPSDEALAHLFGEAEAVFDRQMTILERLDEKAARIVRFNTLILGLLIAATSLASGQTRIDEAMPAWVSIGFAAALALLVFSTFAAILAHRAQKLRIGLRVERIVEASQRDVDDRAGKRSAPTADA